MKSKLTVKKMVMVSLLTCLIAICSWLTIPLSVPVTLQTFAVFCSVVLLGGELSFCSVILYILLGLVGVPVFSGFSGGAGHLFGPTGGYIVGFIFIPIIYLLFTKLIQKSDKFRFLALGLGLIVCYAFGTGWFCIIMNQRNNNYGFVAALTVCVIPFIIPDIVKLIVAVIVSDKVKRYLKQ